MNPGKAINVINDITRGNPLRKDVESLKEKCADPDFRSQLARYFLITTQDLDRIVYHGLEIGK